MAKLTCPYCYGKFAEKEIAFRCGGLRPIGGDPCPPERDPVREKALGDNTHQLPVVPGNGKKLSATCKKCGNETTIQICPHCHSQLPVHYSKIDNHMVAMIGAKFSGKSVYMTVLLHELVHRVGRRFDAAVTGADERTRKEFSSEERTLYAEGVLPVTTRTAAADRGRAPFVFRVSLGEQKRFRSTLRHTVLSFFDTAGEDLESDKGVAENVRYLSCADGIVVLLDPLTIPNVMEKFGLDESVLPSSAQREAAKADSPINILTRVTEVLQKLPGAGPNKMIEIPVAVAFSKVDALWEGLPEDSPLRQPAPATPYFDEPDSSAIHAYVQALLYEWEGGQIDQLLSKNFRTFRYFGLSALGAVPPALAPGQQRQKVGGTIAPHRVEDPFLWLLSRLKVIETGKD
jgi:Double-GTPase 2